MLTAQQQSGIWPFDPANSELLDKKLDKVHKFVGDTVETMAQSLSVSPDEALEILIKVHVAMMGDLKKTVNSFTDEKLFHRVDRDKMCSEIEDVIKAISDATALDTEEITDIFAKNLDANLADISYRLHLRSLINRSYTS